MNETVCNGFVGYFSQTHHFCLVGGAVFARAHAVFFSERFSKSLVRIVTDFKGNIQHGFIRSAKQESGMFQADIADIARNGKARVRQKNTVEIIN